MYMCYQLTWCTINVKRAFSFGSLFEPVPSGAINYDYIAAHDVFPIAHTVYKPLLSQFGPCVSKTLTHYMYMYT